MITRSPFVFRTNPRTPSESLEIILNSIAMFLNHLKKHASIRESLERGIEIIYKIVPSASSRRSS